MLFGYKSLSRYHHNRVLSLELKSVCRALKSYALGVRLTYLNNLSLSHAKRRNSHFTCSSDLSKGKIKVR